MSRRFETAVSAAGRSQHILVPKHGTSPLPQRTLTMTSAPLLTQMSCPCEGAWPRHLTCLISPTVLKQVLQLSARTNRPAACLPAGSACRVQAVDRGLIAFTQLAPWGLC